MTIEQKAWDPVAEHVKLASQQIRSTGAEMREQVYVDFGFCSDEQLAIADVATQMIDDLVGRLIELAEISQRLAK